MNWMLSNEEIVFQAAPQLGSGQGFLNDALFY